ncbi:MAG: hypothetical protein DCC63_13580 [Nitrospira sp.]|nr:MAG: hypothetical protein DCC63_13580 [Nitrospira sp.]
MLLLCMIDHKLFREAAPQSQSRLASTPFVLTPTQSEMDKSWKDIQDERWLVTGGTCEIIKDRKAFPLEICSRVSTCSLVSMLVL